MFALLLGVSIATMTIGLIAAFVVKAGRNRESDRQRDHQRTYLHSLDLLALGLREGDVHGWPVGVGSCGTLPFHFVPSRSGGNPVIRARLTGAPDGRMATWRRGYERDYLAIAGHGSRVDVTGHDALFSTVATDARLPRRYLDQTSWPVVQSAVDALVLLDGLAILHLPERAPTSLEPARRLLQQMNRIHQEES
jgi:hypothetical protein